MHTLEADVRPATRHDRHRVTVGGVHTVEILAVSCGVVRSESLTENPKVVAVHVPGVELGTWKEQQ